MEYRGYLIEKNNRGVYVATKRLKYSITHSNPVGILRRIDERIADEANAELLAA